MKKILSLLLIGAVTVMGSQSFAKDRTREVIKQIQKKDAMVVKTIEMEYKKFGNRYFIRINPGQPIIATIKDFCKQKNITLASVSGVGSLQSVTLGFFNPKTKDYKEKVLKEPLEMANLAGNITTKDGEPVLHFHTTVAGNNYKAYAGHMVEAEVSLTAEIILDTIPGKIEKTYDPRTGLNLFDFTK